MNRLAGQTSPYLAAHASDPVDWRPWGREAFADARRLERPILLSVGYQSCHWCHVMQRESFRDPETAALINDQFVAVKVDRELRPDVDRLYLSYVILATGRGGWPMTVLLTPDLLPFFGGTYFPKKAPPDMVSFTDLLNGAAKAWRESLGDVADAAAEARDALTRVMGVHPTAGTPERIALSAAPSILALNDLAHGGTVGAPKFPQLPLFDYLLAVHQRNGDHGALDMAQRWMANMLRGGIYDQAGGGLFRYATDAHWLVPHFEKMLYDSATLLSSIARLHRISPGPELAWAARGTARFLDRDLACRTPDGAFAGYYSSLDAETGGVEGGTYVWPYDDLAAVLDSDDLDFAETYLGVRQGGNWHGTTILTRAETPDSAFPRLEQVLGRLFEARAYRPQPAVITNRITEWNALAARGLIEAGSALEDADLLGQGLTVVDWLVENAIRGHEVLHAVGEPSVAGLDLLAGYAAVTAALITAAELGGRDDLLGLAEELLDATLDGFGSPEGVLYETTASSELPVRPVNWDDSPLPSGASTTAENLARLRPDDLLERQQVLSALAWSMSQMPAMAGNALRVALL